jgi:hypothetical protein
MSVLHHRPAAFVTLVIVQLFGVALAIGAAGDVLEPIALPGSWRLAQYACLLCAFAAWPILGIRAVQRGATEPRPATSEVRSTW